MHCNNDKGRKTVGLFPIEKQTVKEECPLISTSLGVRAKTMVDALSVYDCAIDIH